MKKVAHSDTLAAEGIEITEERTRDEVMYDNLTAG